MCKVTFALSDVIVSSNGGRQSRDELSDVTRRKLGYLLHSQSCQSMLGVWLHCQGTHCLSAGGCAPELTSHVALLISPSAASRLYQQIWWFFETSQYPQAYFYLWSTAEVKTWCSGETWWQDWFTYWCFQYGYRHLSADNVSLMKYYVTVILDSWQNQISFVPG